MIDAAKNFHIGRHSIAEDLRSFFVAHGKVAFSGPWTMAHDCRTPNESEQVAELCGHAVQIAGSKSRTNSIVVAIQRIERFAQVKQLREFAKRWRVVIEIVLKQRHVILDHLENRRRY